MSFQNCAIIGKSVNSRDYHARKEAKQRGDPQYPVSPSMLVNFARSPRRWLRGYVAPDSEAKDYGNLIDTLLLTPELFDKTYAVQPDTYESKSLKCPVCGSISDAQKCKKCSVERGPHSEQKKWNNLESSCAAWTKGKLESGLEITRKDAVLDVAAAITRLREDAAIAAFLDACDKQVLVRGEWADKFTGIVVPVECLIDLAPRKDSPYGDSLADFKTTRNGAAMPWQRWVHSAKYHLQAAFDLELFIAATGEDRNTWRWIIQENYAPWEPAARIASQDLIEHGRGVCRRLLGDYCKCIKANEWPGYDQHDESLDGWTLVALEPWMANEEAFGPRFAFDSEAPELSELSEPETDDIMP